MYRLEGAIVFNLLQERLKYRPPRIESLALAHGVTQ
jgi:hypothetical protein